MIKGFTNEEVGGYEGIKEKFITTAAWPNFTRQYMEMVKNGDNTTAYQQQYAHCGRFS